jgi:hypothetical protein
MEQSRAMTVGTPVLVRNQFNGAWAPDFQVAAVEAEGCWVRRNRDGAVLPKVIGWDDVRVAPEFVLDLTARWAG